MNKDEILSAYMDGELSLEMAEKVEKEWSQKQLDHFLKEKEFESCLREKLSESCDCPDELWESVRSKLGNSRKRKNLPLMITVASLAAALIFIFNIPVDNVLKSQETVSELAEISKTGNSIDDVNKFLRQRGVKLRLLNIPEHQLHTQDLVGANIENIDGEDIPVVYFDCCGSAVKIYLLPKDSSLDQRIQGHDIEVKAQTTVDNYRLVLVSRHGGINILDSFT